MISLRLIRTGRRNQPSFRIVAQNKKRAPKGKYIEALGTWSPLLKTKNINRTRVLYWLSCGAKPTNTVWNMLVREGIIKGAKRSVHAKPKSVEKGDSTSQAIPPGR